ncbi:permease prefix domain 1-containing protein [Brachybacterium paraconglomeratum]|uniref:permease prefix domain 1-containing protein n=1 Tax=Brachybacterium paraconglomeratum TaxID=173362 RepID=UPI0022E230EA|nr:permease prefix domain 1-containing protein [Brachybacterium paraconglomeratum]
MSATLTERYISATIRSLPAESQEDVRAELAASIADAVEARTEQGEDPEAAEREVLTGLGDPAVLAAGYADRPLHLLGPRYYLTWRRLLILLLWIVPACALVGVGLSQALIGADTGTIIGQAISTALTAAVHVTFWTTLVFVVLERTGADTAETWSVEDLPEPKETGTGRADLIASLVFLGLVLAALGWDRLIGLVRIEDDWLPVLHPGLWPLWTLLLVAIVLAEMVHAIVLHARGRWSTGLAVANTVLALLFAGWALALFANDLLLSPELLQLARTVGDIDAQSMHALGVILVVSILAVAAWDVVDGWLKTLRDRRR